MLSFPSMEASHLGLLLCKAMGGQEVNHTPDTWIHCAVIICHIDMGPLSHPMGMIKCYMLA